MKLLAVLLIAGCDHRPHVTNCDDDLHGVWVGSDRWMILDEHEAIEAYPLFIDNDSGNPDVIAAPRVIDLHRDGGALAGELERRYMHRADECVTHVPVHVTACKDDTLDIVFSDVPYPLTLAPCSWPQPPSSRVEHWRRE